MTAVAIDSEAEEAALGVAFMSGGGVVQKMLDAGLRPHHFYYERNRQVFEAMLALSERAVAVDQITVRQEMQRLGSAASHEQLAQLIARFLGPVPNAANFISYANAVVESALWRNRQQAVGAMQRAVDSQDYGAFVEAESRLDAEARPLRTVTLTPEMWATALYDFLERGEGGEIPLPFPRLTDAMYGGLRPGEVMLVAGYTSHGKSIFADQMLDMAAKHGKRVHLYMTEMTAVQRGLRMLARRTGISFKQLRTRKLSDHDRRRVVDELGRLPYGVTIAADWSIEEVVRDGMRGRWDLVVIDLIHGFPYQDERGLDHLSKAAARLARVSTTLDGHDGTAVVTVAHLNESQTAGRSSLARPKPGMQSIKGSSSLKQDSDFVCFVWQQDDDEGMPTGEGKIWLPKARSGDTTTVEVVVNHRRFQFDMAAR